MEETSAYEREHRQEAMDPLCPDWDPKSLDYPDPETLYHHPDENATSSGGWDEARWIVHHRIYRTLSAWSGGQKGFLPIAEELFVPDSWGRASYSTFKLRDNQIHQLFGSTKTFMEGFLLAYRKLKPFRPSGLDYTLRELREILTEDWDYESYLTLLASLELIDNPYCQNAPKIMESLMDEWYRFDADSAFGGTCSMCGGGESRYRDDLKYEYGPDDEEEENPDPNRPRADLE